MTILRKSTTTLLIAMIFATGLMAQPRQGMRMNQNQNQYQNPNCRLEMVSPDLTEDQKASLQELRAEQLKTTQDYRNQMGEIRASQRTLMSATPVDQKAVGQLIDEKTSLNNKHLKANVSHQTAVSEILTDEQLLVFNQMKNRNQNFARQGVRGNNNFRQGRADMRRGQGRMGGQGRQGGQGRAGGQYWR